MKIRHLILIALLWVVPEQLLAQSIQYNFDTKVIYTDSLQMPRNTLAYSLLMILPEMLQRPGETLLSNYDVKIDGVSVGNANDVALNQLMIADIEKIEVSESPVSSYLNNGVGGSINLVLRSKPEDNRHTWGSVGLSAFYPADLGPQFLLTHKRDKLTFKTLFLADLYRNTWSEDRVLKDVSGGLINREHTENDYRYRSQLSNIYMVYQPTDRDVLKLELAETSYHLDTKVTPDYDDSQVKSNNRRMFSLDAVMKYEHKFNNAKLLAQLQFGHSPQKQELFFADIKDLSKDSKQHKMAGQIQLSGNLLPAESKTSVNWNVGNTFNFVRANDEIYNSLFGGGANGEANPVNNTHFIQPYAQVDMKSGRLRMKLMGEFQHYCYELKRMEQDYDMSRNDLTGKFITEWHFNNRQFLRLVMDRKLNRPSANQLFPFIILDPEALKYIQGNPELSPILSHEVSLDFISFHQRGDHSFTYNASVSYNMEDELINAYSVSSGSAPSYMTYENNGHSKILNANLMALYRYKQFMVSATANGYHKMETLGSADSKYNYFNVSVHPEFNLSDGWHGGVQTIYYSKVKLQSGTLSDCCLTQMTVGKQWRNLFLYFYDRVTLHKQALDKSHTPDRNQFTYYEMVPNSLGVGVKYSF